jgi:putative transposase
MRSSASWLRRTCGNPFVSCRIAFDLWPVERPANWTARVNAPLTQKELDRVRVSIERGRPYDEETWVRETVKELGLEQTVRPEGRPRKASGSATEATS